MLAYVVSRNPASIKRFGVSAAWVAIGNGSARGSLVAAMFPVAWILGQRDFGTFSLILGLLSAFEVLGNAGLNVAATTEIARRSKQQPSGVSTTATHLLLLGSGLSVTSACGLALAAQPLSSYLQDSGLRWPIVLSAMSLPSVIIGNVALGVLSGLESFRAMALIRVTGGLATFCLLVLGAKIGGIPGALLGFALASAIQAMVAVVSTNAAIPVILRRIQWGEARALLNIGVPTALSGLLVGPVNWYCLSILSKGVGGPEAVAVIAVAQQWRLLLLFVPLVVNQVMLPRLVDSVSSGQLLLRTFAVNVTAALLTIVPIFFASSLILAKYGSDFVVDQLAFQLIVLSTVLLAAANTLGQGLLARGKMWWGLASNAGWAVVMISASILLIPSHGAAGLAFATLVAYAMHLVAQWLIVRRLMLVSRHGL